MDEYTNTKETDTPDTRENSHSKRVARTLKRLNDSHHALWLLFVISFMETIIIPIPIELVLIPFMITNRHRVWKTAAFVTAGCLAASMVGYGIGYFLFDILGQQVVEWMNWQQQYEQYQALFNKHGFFAIILVGVIPIPFQVAMLAAGTAGYAVWKFVIAATIARGIRYYGLAVLVALFGDKAEAMWKKHKVMAMLIVLAIVMAFWGLTHWLAATRVTG